MHFRAIATGWFGGIAVMCSASAAEVCTAVADAATGQILVQRGDCRRQVTPASTFKIAISLMGYDAGVLGDEHQPVLPFRDGYVDWRPSWREPADPARWMKESVVWYSQQVTRSLGAQRFGDYVRKFQYGNADVSGDAQNEGLTMSWLSSSLRISPLEQLSFLTRVVNRQFDIGAHAYDMTSRLMVFEQPPEGWRVHGKTGAASGYGWYVGWATKGARTFVFARLIQRDQSQPQEVSIGVLARDGLIAELPALLAEPGHQAKPDLSARAGRDTLLVP